MNEYVNCQDCQTDCARAKGVYGYTICSCHTARKPTNGDRIRAMTNDEMAEWCCINAATITACDVICNGECKAYATLGKTSEDVCKQIVLDWLEQEVDK